MGAQSPWMGIMPSACHAITFLCTVQIVFMLVHALSRFVSEAWSLWRPGVDNGRWLFSRDVRECEHVHAYAHVHVHVHMLPHVDVHHGHAHVVHVRSHKIA